MKILNSYLFIGILSILLGCQNPQAAKPEHSAAPTISSLRDEIRNLTRDTRCNQNTQCQVAGDTVKACGGFRSFLVYATPNVNEKELHTKLTTYYTLQKDRIARSGMVSDCAYITPPPAACVNARCVIESAPSVH
mgnify:CR=1 FL=1